MNFKIEEVPPFYQGYIKQISDDQLITSLDNSCRNVVSLCENLDETQALYRYADGKWSIKDLIQHLIDTDLVFTYRAMRFARNDHTELSGFEQDDYVKEVFADKFLLKDLLIRFKNMRKTTLDLFTSFSETELTRKAKSNGVEMSVEMIGYIISGHTQHHLKVIQERYLS